MTHDQQYEGWVRGIIAKRTPDSLRVLSDVCEAALRKGYASANDVRECDFAQKNIIGATFRILPGLGFVKTSVTEQSTGKRRNGGTIFQWRLDDSTKVRLFMQRIARALFDRHDDGQGQGLLAM
jgi:hypothetical protein